MTIPRFRQRSALDIKVNVERGGRIPADAGMICKTWMPASAGMTIKEVVISAPTKAFEGRLQWDKKYLEGIN
jgi:hypothetical protein